MKKVFALVLAVAMVLSLSAVAFATNTNSYLSDEKGDVLAVINVEKNKIYTYASGAMSEAGDSVAFGKTVYYALLTKEETEVAETSDVETAVTDAKSVAGLKVTSEFTEGAAYVKSVEIVKKAGAYYVAVATTGSDLDGVTVDGKIYLKGTSGTGDNKVKVNHYFTVSFALAYADGTVGDKKTEIKKSGLAVYDYDDVTKDEWTIEFADAASVVANVKNEDKILLGYDLDEIDEIVDAYPDANLDFVALTGTFKKTAEVTVYADEGSYLYQVVDGAVKAVKAEYDEYEEAFVFNTKTLGTYVISDVELTATAAVVDTTTANPSTGAAA